MCVFTLRGMLSGVTQDTMCPANSRGFSIWGSSRELLVRRCCLIGAARMGIRGRDPTRGTSEAREERQLELHRAPIGGKYRRRVGGIAIEELLELGSERLEGLGRVGLHPLAIRVIRGARDFLAKRLAEVRVQAHAWSHRRANLAHTAEPSGGQQEIRVGEHPQRGLDGREVYLPACCVRSMESQLVEDARDEVMKRLEPTPIRAARQGQRVRASERVEKVRVLANIRPESVDRQTAVGEATDEWVRQARLREVLVGGPELAGEIPGHVWHRRSWGGPSSTGNTTTRAERYEDEVASQPRASAPTLRRTEISPGAVGAADMFEAAAAHPGRGRTPRGRNVPFCGFVAAGVRQSGADRCAIGAARISCELHGVQALLD